MGLGLAVATLGTIDGAERDEGAGETGIVGPEGLLGERCRLLGERGCLRVLAGTVERKNAVVGRLELGVGLGADVLSQKQRADDERCGQQARTAKPQDPHSPGSPATEERLSHPSAAVEWQYRLVGTRSARCRVQ